MPVLSLGQLASRATTMAGGRMDIDLSEASFWVNAAVAEVSSRAGLMHTPKEALAISSTTSGGNRIALPTDWDYALAVTIQAGSSSTATTSHTTTLTPLRQVEPAWIDSQTLEIDVPETYAPYSTWLELFPSPNSAYTVLLRYMTKTPTLVASTDTPVLDERWHLAVLYKTVELLHAARDDREGEAWAHNRYLNYASGTLTDRAAKQQDKRGMAVRYVKKLD